MNTLQLLGWGAIAYMFLSHMMRTFPPVENKWVLWLVGGLQYLLSNPDIAEAIKRQLEAKRSVPNV